MNVPNIECVSKSKDQFFFLMRQSSNFINRYKMARDMFLKNFKILNCFYVFDVVDAGVTRTSVRLMSRRTTRQL